MPLGNDIRIIFISVCRLKKDGGVMLKIRIEFYKEEEQTLFLKYINKEYEVLVEDNVKLSKAPGSKMKIQYLEVEKRDEIH